MKLMKSQKLEKKKSLLGAVLLLASVLSGCAKVNVTDLPEAVNTSGNPTGDPTGNQNPLQTANSLLKPASNKVDLLLVIDNSGSMKPDSLELASKLEGFVQKLESFSLDWQMCLAVTDIDHFSGRALPWSGLSGGVVLKKGTANLANKFYDTINGLEFGQKDSGDERGIAAMSMNLDQRASNRCYRAGAALSTLVISDEDERSVGGNASLSDKQYMPIEDIDKPENYISKVQAKLGDGVSAVPLTSHSIIIQPSDQSCLDEQNNQGYPGFVGTLYNKLSQLTGGSVGSICSRDYSSNLSVFADQIQKSLQRVKLNCVPADGWKISASPALPDLRATVDRDYIVIESTIAQDTNVSIQYRCK